MTIITFIWIACLVELSGCSPSSVPVGNKRNHNASANDDTASNTSLQKYPILKYSREEDSEVLLKHKATDAERELFQRMDSAVVALNDDPELDQCYAAILPIGSEAGLSAEQSIAFWTRMTFSEFEP